MPQMMITRLPILDRYILRQVAVTTAVITVSLTLLVWISQSLKLVDFIINRGIPLNTFFYLAVLALPGLLPTLLPLTCFASILFVFHRKNADSELIALHACGFPQAMIGRMALAFSALLCLFSFLLTLHFAPKAQIAFKDLQFKLRNDYSITLLEEGVFTEIGRNITVFVRERDAEGGLLGILVHDSRDKDRPITILAERGLLQLRGGSPMISVGNGSRQMIDKKTGEVAMLYFDGYTLDLSQIMSEQELQRDPDPKELPLRALFNPDPKLNERTKLRYASIAHQRLISPFLIVTFGLIALAAFRDAQSRKQAQLKPLLFAIAAVVILQAVMLALFNAIGNSSPPWHWLLTATSYILPLAVCAACVHWLGLNWRKLKNPG